MTQSTITRLRELEAKATKGEWYTENLSVGSTVWAGCFPTGSMQVAGTGHAQFDDTNAQLIAEMRNNLSKLLDVAEAAERYVYCNPGSEDEYKYEIGRLILALSKLTENDVG